MNAKLYPYVLEYTNYSKNCLGRGCTLSDFCRIYNHNLENELLGDINKELIKYGIKPIPEQVLYIDDVDYGYSDFPPYKIRDEFWLDASQFKNDKNEISDKKIRDYIRKQTDYPVEHLTFQLIDATGLTDAIATIESILSSLEYEKVLETTNKIQNILITSLSKSCINQKNITLKELVEDEKYFEISLTYVYIDNNTYLQKGYNLDDFKMFDLNNKVEITGYYFAYGFCPCVNAKLIQ